MKGTTVADDARDRTGPLSERQIKILQLIGDGRTHAQIADILGTTRPTVSQIITGSIHPKMNVRKTNEAVARLFRAEGLNLAARKLRDGMVQQPCDEAEVHVNHVLDAFAAELEALARKQLPS